MEVSMIKRRRILGVASITLALALGAAACGDDDEEAEEVSAETVTVTATDDVETAEYLFDLSTTPTAETKEVSFHNDGTVPHELIFARINEGFTTEEAIELEGGKGSADLVGTSQGPIQPGASTDVKLRGPLEPGPYAMLCALRAKEGPHYELGQLEEFEISG
jgi:hypothetical protein